VASISMLSAMQLEYGKIATLRSWGALEWGWREGVDRKV
jgi:hypothetical protein